MKVIVRREDESVAEEWGPNCFRCAGEAYSTFNLRLLDYKRLDRGHFDSSHMVELYDDDGKLLQFERSK